MGHGSGCLYASSSWTWGVMPSAAWLEALLDKSSLGMPTALTCALGGLLLWGLLVSLVKRGVPAAELASA